MDQIQQYAKTYQEYKRELDTELSKTAEGFVRIGYLLKVARDTDVLSQSPYQTVTEFARAEYGIDKTVVSRFISINDRFSEGGYSDQLQEQFRGYGYSKLALMLSLPDEITQELSPAYSKAEIQAIKDEVDEEKAISDLEVMMEGQPDQAPESSLLDMLVYQLGEDSPELYVQMARIVDMEDPQKWFRKAIEILAPDGEKQYSIRISGMGRFLVSIRETENEITVTAIRSLEKSSYTYHAFQKAWAEILPAVGGGTEKDNQDSWEIVYNREFPGKVKVAPVQPPEKTKSNPAPRKESKVQKAPKPKPMGKEPIREAEPPAPEPGKPKSKGMEPVSDEKGQELLEAEQPAQELEKPEKTGTEGVSEPEIEFAPGMRIRNKAGNPHFPTTPGTILGRHWSVPAWNVRFDGLDMTKLIYDTDIKEFEIIKEEPYGEDDPVDTPAEDQLPGQIGIEEAIAEADARMAEKACQDEVSPAAGQEIDEELDLQWSRIKNTINGYMESGVLDKRLYNISPAALRTTRTDLIKMTNVIEKELRRRGERF